MRDALIIFNTGIQLQCSNESTKKCTKIAVYVQHDNMIYQLYHTYLMLLPYFISKILLTIAFGVQETPFTILRNKR